MAPQRGLKVPATPRPRPVRISKKPTQPMSPDGAVTSGVQTRLPTRGISSLHPVLGQENMIGPDEQDPEPAVLLKYTPQGATMAKAMNNFEDVFQTPGPVSGKGTQDSPIEIFELDRPRPPPQRLFRRGLNPQQLILQSPARVVRHAMRKVKQIAAKGEKRKREVVDDAIGDEVTAPKEPSKKKTTKRTKRTKGYEMK